MSRAPALLSFPGVHAADHSIAAGRIDQVVYQAAARRPLSWPIRIGSVSALASAFQTRLGPLGSIEAARRGGLAVVLTQVLTGRGGVGKSQLAAFHADQAIRGGVDLVVWVDATRTEAIVATYAQAADRIGVPGAGSGDGDADAAAFLDWLATTDRSWLVVLDDLIDLDHLRSWWPTSHTGTGWVLATTRRRDAALSGGGRSVVNIDVYNVAESVAYLCERLTGAGHPDLVDHRAAQLAAQLGHLPLALSHAAAYMINEGIGCGRYLELFTAEQTRLDELMPASADSDQYGRPVAVTLLLALDAAQAADLSGLVLPALRLVALLDPAGHPDMLWNNPSVIAYLAAHRTDVTSPHQRLPGRRDADHPDTATRARAAIRLLHRYGLATHDPHNAARAVGIHALTARAVRETIPAACLATAARAAADALLAAWPQVDTSLDLADWITALRVNTDILASHAEDGLWDPDGHTLLYQAGVSLVDAGLYTLAMTYWQGMVADAMRIVGPAHPNTLTAQTNLAVSYRLAGRTAEAIALHEQVTADTLRILGADKLHTLATRANLATAYWQAGRIDEAIVIDEQVLEDVLRILGADHPATLVARSNLATSYRQAGHTAEAITIEQQGVADRLRVLGPDHPDTLAAQTNLADSYRQAGRTGEAITIIEQVTADAMGILGPDHPRTLSARANLAASYRQAGRTAEAITIQEPLAADTMRIFGPDHPETLTAQANLAVYYQQAGRTAEAITIEELVAADRLRILGPDHPHTLAAQTNLADSYRQADRANEAITILEQVTAGTQRILGPDHPETLRARAGLAACARSTSEAITILEEVAADAVRIFGPDHPDALSARANLAVSFWQAGRIAEAIIIQEQGAADAVRIFGPDHPDTLRARTRGGRGRRAPGRRRPGTPNR